MFARMKSHANRINTLLVRLGSVPSCERHTTSAPRFVRMHRTLERQLHVRRAGGNFAPLLPALSFIEYCAVMQHDDSTCAFPVAFLSHSRASLMSTRAPGCTHTHFSRSALRTCVYIHTCYTHMCNFMDAFCVRKAIASHHVMNALYLKMSTQALE